MKKHKGKHSLFPRSILGVISLLLGFGPSPFNLYAQGSVANTVHNLSISGPGTIKSSSETEICKFCHIPHNAELPQPLWGHALSDVTLYQVPEIRRPGGGIAPAPQPNGASRLCLSCHDGTVALGDVGGERIPMMGSQTLGSGQRGFIGTDLSGSHPISFQYPEDDPNRTDTDFDIGVKPRAAIAGTRYIRLDADAKMQCTTCHDPHKDDYFVPGRVPRFWVAPTVEDVCLTCHELR